MQAYAVSYSKYMIAASMVLYTFLAYVALPSGKDVRRTCETLQRLCLGVFTINAYLTMAILAGDEYIFTFGILQLLIVLGASLLYRTLYKSANMLMINNIMMLLSIGLVMITRINQAKAQKQLLISLAGMVFLMVIPLLRSRFDSLRKGTYFYGILGIASLGAVLLLGAITNGSKISFTIAGMTFQPSEFVKILFILFMASAMCEENSKSHIAILTAAALAHVGILVLSRDLGSALIFFVIYLTLLFLSTGNWNILAGGLLLGLITAVICFFLFSHVRVRVQVFLDPWTSIDGNGYQITQALFALSFGGLFGAGLMQGMPSSIPFVESDFIFAAIVEEMGILFGICLILLCLNIQQILQALHFWDCYRLYFPSFSDDRRGSEVHSPDRCDTAACELRRKFGARNLYHVRHCGGDLPSAGGAAREIPPALRVGTQRGQEQALRGRSQSEGIGRISQRQRSGKRGSGFLQGFQRSSHL